MRHTIKTQIIELSIPEQRQAFTIQHEVSNYFWNEIAPQLEKAFNAIAGEDEYIKIDRLELDLGAITLRQMKDGKLAAMIAELLQAELANVKGEKTKRPERRVVSRALSYCEQWFYFIEKGYLPWNAEKPADTWLQQVIEALATDYDHITRFKKIILSKPRALQRIIMQHRPGFLVKLVEVMTAKKQSALLQIVPALATVMQMIRTAQRAHGNALSANEAVSFVWQNILTMAANDRKLLPLEFVEQILEDEIKEPSVITLVLPQVSSKAPDLLPVLKAVHERKLQARNIQQRNTEHLHKPSPGVGVNESQPASSHENTEPRKEMIAPVTPPGAGREAPVKTQEPPQQFSLAEIPPEGIFVVHAGLVLLYPYLTIFFKRVQLVNDGKFIDHECRLQAVQLLYFMATGNTDIPEYELVIAKLLCALPLAEPISLQAEVPPEAFAEADELLKVFIERWEKLKRSSVAAVREGFLQRPGKLFVSGGRLQLMIEGHGIDVLLDWKSAMIKLPWMEQFLVVDWGAQH